MEPDAAMVNLLDCALYYVLTSNYSLVELEIKSNMLNSVSLHRASALGPNLCVKYYCCSTSVCNAGPRLYQQWISYPMSYYFIVIIASSRIGNLFI